MASIGGDLAQNDWDHRAVVQDAPDSAYPEQRIDYRYLDPDLVAIQTGTRQFLRVQRDDARRVSELALADVAETPQASGSRA